METDLPHQSALSTESSPSSLQSVVEERRHKAQVNRDKLMRQISDMQKAFLEKHKKELDEVDYAAETTMYAPVQDYVKTCIKGLWLLLVVFFSLFS